MKAFLFVVLATAVLGAAAPPPQGATAPSPPSPLARERRVTTRYDDSFRKYSRRYFGATFDWKLFKAQAMAESNLVPTARSNVGARGLMQLMPTTYAQIASTRPNYKAIDDPQSNIAAGILHDRGLWSIWDGLVAPDDRPEFMFGSYNAGDMTIARARGLARRAQLDPELWASVVQVAPKVTRWKYRETLGYVKAIEENYAFLTPPPHAVVGGD